MNSCLRSSVMCPVAVSDSISSRHSASVSPTSVANAWRCATKACISSRSRGSGQPSKLATAVAVISAGEVLSSALIEAPIIAK